jgi:hypothetical protein
MAELTFAQSERRNFLVPGLIALATLAIGLAVFSWLNPHRVPSVTVTHASTLPTHTVFKTDTKLVGAQDQAQDDFYVLATVHIDNRLKYPLTINEITGTFNAPDDTVETTTAIGKNDLPNLYVTFPALKPLSGPPLLPETTTEPGAQTEGMVLLGFPVTEADWNQRKSATITLTFYHQDPITVVIPKT